MNLHLRVFCVLFLIGAAYFFYLAQSEDDGNNALVPQFQTEAQVGGLGVQAGMAVKSPSPGDPLDLSFETHFWSPGNGRDEHIVNCPRPVKTPHRYPVVPGGNISTVMHKGWGAFNTDAPAGNEWILNPPSAAVL